MRLRLYLVLLFVLILFSLSFVSAACSQDQLIMRLSSQTNAHVQEWRETSYSNEICYTDFWPAYTGADPHACTGTNKIVGIPSSIQGGEVGPNGGATNAHAEKPEFVNYGWLICYGDLECVSSTTTCNSGYTQTLSLSDDTNAHAELPGGSYPVKICCKTGVAPPAGNRYWASMDNEAVLLDRAQINDTVKLIWKNSGITSGNVDFEIKEDDDILGYDDIRTVSGTARADGTVVATWTITQEDYNKGDTILKPEFLVNNDEEFVFTVGGDKSDLLLVEKDSYDNAKPTAVIVKPAEGSKFLKGAIINFEQASHDKDDDLKVLWNFGDGTDSGWKENCSTTSPGIDSSTTADLVSYWKFQDNANDETGVNNGAWFGTSAYSSGVAGQAASFDGASYIEVADSASLKLGNRYTISAWVKPKPIIPIWQPVLEKGQPGISRYMFWILKDPVDNNNKLGAIGHKDPDPDYTASTGDDIPLNEWTHIAFSFDYYANPQVRAWKNGVELALINNTGIGPTPSSTNVLRIGANNDLSTNAHYFSGLIDEVKIWNKALSAAEIRGDMCDSMHSYTTSGTKIISLTAQEMTRSQQDKNYTQIYIYEQGINVFAKITEPNPLVYPPQSYDETVPFDAKDSFAAECSLTCPAGKTCYQVSDGTTTLNCYDFLKTDIPSAYNLKFNWTFDEGGERAGWWDTNYNGVVEFNKHFSITGIHKAELEVGYSGDGINILKSDKTNTIFNIAYPYIDPTCVVNEAGTFWVDSSSWIPSENDCHRDNVAQGSANDCCPAGDNCVDNVCVESNEFPGCQRFTDENSCNAQKGTDDAEKLVEADPNRGEGFCKSGYFNGECDINVKNCRCAWDNKGTADTTDDVCGGKWDIDSSNCINGKIEATCKIEPTTTRKEAGFIYQVWNAYYETNIGSIINCGDSNPLCDRQIEKSLEPISCSDEGKCVSDSCNKGERRFIWGERELSWFGWWQFIGVLILVLLFYFIKENRK